MATRLIGTDSADPRLPALVIAATQGTTSADLAPGNVLGTPTAYTPAITVWTLGNGTATGRYIKHGRLVHFWAKITFGSTSVFTTGNPTVSLPVTGASTASNHRLAGINVSCSDTSASSSVAGRCIYSSTTTVQPLCFVASSTYVTDGGVINTAPFTWATTDVLELAGWYEAAS